MTKQSKISCITSLGLFLAAAPALMAQVTTGQISGRVADTDNRPIRGARVVLTAPQLMRQREVMTDANGEWRALLLPPGDYAIRISSDGHVGSSVRNIRIGIGSALRHDIVLKPIAVASETIEIGGAEGIVADKTDTKTAISYSADSLAQLTGGRDFGSAAALSVGVVSTGGGTYSIRGGQTNSTLIRLDGADIKEPLENRVNAVWYVADQIEEVAVVLSPLNARYGRTLGGALEVVTKSGGNEFSGTMRVNAGRNSWNAESRSFREYTDLVFDSANSRNQDFTLGGPIIKDSLWFTVAVMKMPETSGIYRTSNPDRRYVRTHRAYDGPNSNGIWHDGINNLTAIDPNTLLVASTAAPQLRSGNYYFPYPWNTNGDAVTHGYPTWDALNQQRNTTTTRALYSGKLTYGINENHKITIGGQYQPWIYKNMYIQYRDEQAVNAKFNAQGVSLAYHGIFGAATFAEVKFNRQKQWNTYMELNGTDSAKHAIMLWLDGFSGAPQYYLNSTTGSGNVQPSGSFYGQYNGVRGGMDDRNNAFGSANLTMYRDFWGVNHNIDTGLEYFQADLSDVLSIGPDNATYRVGGIYQNPQGNWLFPTLKWIGKDMWGQSRSGATGLAPYRAAYFGDTGQFRNTNVSLYFNDQITINDYWNVMLGLRYDKTDSKNLNGTALFGTTDLSPRFVLTYDLKGDNAHVFKFNYSRMQADYSASLSRIFVPGPLTNNVSYVWNGAALPGGPQPNPGMADFGDPNNSGINMYGLRFVTLADIVNPANYDQINPAEFSIGTAQNMRDPNLKPMVNNEFAFEYRRSYQGGSYFRTAYVYRVQSNLWTGKSDYDLSSWVVIGDPTGSGKYASRYGTATYYFNTSDLWRDYHGLEFESVTKINSIFSLNINYTYSRLRGNNEATGNADGTAGYYSYASHLKNVPIEQRSPGGALNNDVPHTASVGLLAVVPLDATRGSWISYSFIVGYESGWNWNATYAAPLPSSVTDTHNRYDDLYNSNPANNYQPPALPISMTWTKWYAARGAYHRNDSYWTTGAISWEVPIWKRVKTMGSLSINNVFNTIYHYDYNRDFVNNTTGSNTLDLESRFGTYRDRDGNLTYTNSPRSASLSIGLKF